MRPYTLHSGSGPLIISIPHAGTHVPPAIAARFSEHGQSLIDTDWFVEKLYPFAHELNATVLRATHSRYVIDLNRSLSDEHLYPGQMKTGLCPLQSFYGDPLYQSGKEPTVTEIASRVQEYWHPYHERLKQEISRVKKAHGYALVFDAHSIKSVVPLLFEGVLSDLNIGTNRNATCHEIITNAAFHAGERTGYKTVLNARFLGGYITRQYGMPNDHVHALQMELTWKNYMNETTLEFVDAKAAKLSAALYQIIDSMMQAAQRLYSDKTAP